MEIKTRPLVVKGGGVRIEIDYRRRRTDEGLRIGVYGGEGADAPEVLRFDCFEKRPHFHYLGPVNRKLERINKKAVPDPVRWTLNRIKKDLSSMFWKAGRRKLGKEINQSAVARALKKSEREIIQLSRG